MKKHEKKSLSLYYLLYMICVWPQFYEYFSRFRLIVKGEGSASWRVGGC